MFVEAITLGINTSKYVKDMNHNMRNSSSTEFNSSDILDSEENTRTNNNNKEIYTILKTDLSQYAQDTIIRAYQLEMYHPKNVEYGVKSLLQRWGNTSAIAPDKFLMKLLQSRGYDTTLIPMASETRSNKLPNHKQLQDYNNELVWAVRTSNLQKLKELYEAGKSMSACNSFSESIVHMACRRSDYEVVEFILNHGGDITITDDKGRTPLHDACWRCEPKFDVVTLILDKNLDLLRYLDFHGSSPLKYVKEEHWIEWCAYFFHQREKYWARLDNKQDLNTSKSENGLTTTSATLNGYQNGAIPSTNHSTITSNSIKKINQSTVPIENGNLCGFRTLSEMSNEEPNNDRYDPNKRIRSQSPVNKTSKDN